MAVHVTSPRRGIFETLGLDRPELRAWALYDLASAVVLDVVVTTLFPAYFSEVAAANLTRSEATAWFAIITTAALALAAILAPILGALTDEGRIRKRTLLVFVGIGATATALLSLVHRGDWVLAAVLFAIANVAIDGAGSLHAALLPHVAHRDELDRTSTVACALGYVAAGSVLALVAAVLHEPAWVGLPSGPALQPDQQSLPVRLAYILSATWWVVFSIPLLLHVREAPAIAGQMHRLRAIGQRLATTFREARRRREAWLFLAASLLYGTGMGTIVRMAVVYGAEVGIDRELLVLAIVGVDLVGTPFAFLFGALAQRVGAKRAILAGLTVYAAVAVLAYFLETATQFFVLAFLVATVQGGVQSLTRSAFASLVPVERSAEFFGLFGTAGKVTAIFGPGLFALVAIATGSSRRAILSTIVLFVAGALVLRTVDLERGGAEARDAGSGAGTR